MRFFDRFRRGRKTPYAALSDEEKMSRYIYLLNTMPAQVIENAHADAFRDVPLERRREMFDQLRPFMSEAEQKESAEPELLARLVRRAEERRTARADGSAQTTPGMPRTTTATAVDPSYEPDVRDVMLRSGVMPLVAYNFLVSAAVFTYFSDGAGSLGLAGEPGWVSDLGSSGAAPGFDSSGGGADGGGYEGGGYDGGGYGGGHDGGGLFGGGFDAGGFGGGFDGGGGFG
jgi:hypothetical protein